MKARLFIVLIFAMLPCCFSAADSSSIFNIYSDRNEMVYNFHVDCSIDIFKNANYDELNLRKGISDKVGVYFPDNDDLSMMLACQINKKYVLKNLSSNVKTPDDVQRLFPGAYKKSNSESTYVIYLNRNDDTILDMETWKEIRRNNKSHNLAQVMFEFLDEKVVFMVLVYKKVPPHY